jgi:hypothetical protein
MSAPKSVSRRDFLNQSLAVAGAAGVAGAAAPAAAGELPAVEPVKPGELPCGMLGKAKISRLLLGGNLISGFMHCRDLKYVNSLFRAYATEEKIIETLKIAEECGINTVFETGGRFVELYNRKYNGHMQFIPHIQIELGQSEAALKDHIKAQYDTGAVALYVWGVAADAAIKRGGVAEIARAVELAKKYDIAVGVGSHSLQVPVECEKHGVPCDFYVKTFHSDEYPSATPKEQRKDFMWMDGGPGWYDNMWCINVQETIDFMKSVNKPWVAFKVLAAGAILPQQGFQHAFKNGADFIAVGMLDFQLRANSELVTQVLRRNQQRERPWRA